MRFQPTTLVLACLLAACGLALPACNDDEDLGKGGGQVSGDSNVVGEDVREQLGGADKTDAGSGASNPGTTTGPSDSQEGRSQGVTGSDQDAGGGPVDPAGTQGNVQEERR